MGGRSEPRWRVLVEPTMLILVAAGIVHIIRRNAFDIALFFGTAALIVVDRWRRPPLAGATRPTRLSGRQRAVVAGCFALYSIIAGQWEIDTWPMRTAMIIPGLLFAGILTVRPPNEDPRASRMGKGWIVWAAIGVAIALWELTSFVQQPNPIDSSYEHPTISAIVSPWLDSWVGRAIFLLLWVSAGFWLIRTIVGGRVEPPTTPDSAADSAAELGEAVEPAEPGVAREVGEARRPAETRDTCAGLRTDRGDG